MLRWIDELNGLQDADDKAREIQRQIRLTRKGENTLENRKLMRKLYAMLDEVQFKPDYLCLVIDRPSDYRRACKGFSINGVRYKRLLGTNGGIKASTIVFVSDRLCGELRRRIENGRDQNKPMVAAKLEAYKALSCSASTPVSMPKGILIVPDCETTFRSDIIHLTDENGGEPTMEERSDQEVMLDASDGFGLMLPALAQRWSEELRLGYCMSGGNTRFAYEKGMVFQFDFLEFVDQVAGEQYLVKDAWGDEKDIRDVELILTTSMVKLWDSYDSCEDYVQKSVENGYSFCITKTCPEELENERNLNYQFIQSYGLSDEDIEALIAPTMAEFKDVLSDDPMKTVLFFRGKGLTPENAARSEPDIAKAMMIDRRVLNDPFVQAEIYDTLRNRIDEAKVGVLRVHGNYSIASGDPYALCQSIWGLPVTGLLRAGEIYNRYWAENGAERLVCFRAPMTCSNNIRAVDPVRREDAAHWYQYMRTCTVFNAWDTAASALNGMDFDGDIVMLTDNPVLVSRMKPLPALMCVQRKAEKRIPTEADFVKSNMESFGNDIGRTTNWITSMFEVQARFSPDSKEYKELSYRIRCGQLYQQNAIDKAKGIIAKPMPRSWHDRHSANEIDDEERRQFYLRIVADRKPYFMIYIYPELRKRFNQYQKNTNKKALREFGKTVTELLEEGSGAGEKERSFLDYYRRKMLVGTGPCVMNRICGRFEQEFDGYRGRRRGQGGFDYRILKSGRDYGQAQYRTVKRLYGEYIKRIQSYKVLSSYTRVDKQEASTELSAMEEDLMRECDKVCPNRETLCDILLDLCYQRSYTKRFVWRVCGEEIIRNLLRRSGGRMEVPCMDPGGEIAYGGMRFTVKEGQVEEELWQ